MAGYTENGYVAAVETFTTPVLKLKTAVRLNLSLNAASAVNTVELEKPLKTAARPAA